MWVLTSVPPMELNYSTPYGTKLKWDRRKRRREHIRIKHTHRNNNPLKNRFRIPIHQRILIFRPRKVSTVQIQYQKSKTTKQIPLNKIYISQIRHSLQQYKSKNQPNNRSHH